MFWRGFGGMHPISTIRGLERLQDELNRVLEAPHPHSSAQRPALNAWTNKDGIVLSAELPGWSEDELHVAVEGNVLTLSGTHKEDPGNESDTWYRRERRLGAFTRTLDLPFKVDPERVDATLTRGILTIKMPRAEEDKPRKISVRPS